MNRIVAYCRVSTDKSDQLNSLENQKEFFEEYAKKNNMNLIKIYADEGISGTSLKNRVELGNLLRDARDNLFDTVVIKDISRLARNAVDFLSSIRKLKSFNISCKFITSNLCTEDGELILGILALVAQEESANLSKRVKFGKQINAHKGRVPNKILGYNRLDNYTLEIDEIEADIIRTIFELYTVNKYGMRKICSILTERKITTRFGSTWYPSTIRRILSNPIYCGIYENNKWEINNIIDKKLVKRPDEDHLFHSRPEWAIIKEDTYFSAQKLLEQRKPKPKQEKKKDSRYSNTHIFSNLIKCNTCGSSFIRKKYKNKEYERIYWKCKAHDQLSSSVCKNATTINENELVDAIRSAVTNDLDANEISEKVYNRFIIEHKDLNIQAQLRKLKNEHSKLERYIQKYSNLFLEDMITIEQLKEKVKSSVAQKKTLDEQINKIENEYNKEHYEAIINKISTDVLAFNNFTNNEIRTLIESIIVSENGEVNIFFKKP